MSKFEIINIDVLGGLLIPVWFEPVSQAWLNLHVIH